LIGSKAGAEDELRDPGGVALKGFLLGGEQAHEDLEFEVAFILAAKAKEELPHTSAVIVGVFAQKCERQLTDGRDEDFFRKKWFGFEGERFPAVAQARLVGEKEGAPWFVGGRRAFVGGWGEKATETEQDVALGAARELPRSGERGAIGLGEDDLTTEPFEIPAMGDEIAGEPVEEFRLGDGAAVQSESGGGKAFAKEVGPYSIDKDPGREGIVFCGEPAGEVEAAGEGGGEVGRKEPLKERFGRGGDRSTPEHWNFAQFCSHGGQPRPGCIQCCLKCALIFRYTREIVSSQIGMIAERVGKGFEEALLVFGMLDFDRSERPVIGMEFIEKKCSGVFLRGAEVQWGRVLCPEEGDGEGVGNGLAGGEVAIEVNFEAVGAAGAVAGPGQMRPLPGHFEGEHGGDEKGLGGAVPVPSREEAFPNAL
jgi:hypothetical protein